MLKFLEFKPDYDKMVEFAEASRSIPHLATKHLIEFFNEEELHGDVNVRGITINGS